ncbi:hypothetical protein [uncultured Ruminococcus sp.]|uniref:hypothetical protein n=1 Tax=uncultured Ruminococcus sp. TaxID=165186 RepID=UPI0025F31CDD|nr:hypothetical protein [uncultured Ruminococcus sp.]
MDIVVTEEKPSMIQRKRLDTVNRCENTSALVSCLSAHLPEQETGSDAFSLYFPTNFSRFWKKEDPGLLLPG